MRRNKILDKLSTKNLTTVFGIALFILVFIFTFLISSSDQALIKGRTIILIVCGSLFVLIIVAWLILFLIVRKYKLTTDENKQKISQAIEKLSNGDNQKNKK